MRGPASRWTIVGAVAAATLAADQLTKWWAKNALADGHTISVVWTLRLALYENTGAAFSMGRDSSWVRFLPLLVLVAVAAVGWRSRAALSRTGAVAVGLIIGGAIGNIVDRAARAEPGGGFFSGGVIDFIDLQWWPVFNVADMGVVIGGILFALVAARGTTAEPDDGGDHPGDTGEVGTAAPPDRSGEAEGGTLGGDAPAPRLADVDSPT